MYMDGRVRLYESTRWITINLKSQFFFSSSSSFAGQREGSVGAHSIPEFLNPEEDIPQRRMMREDLDLTGTIEDDIILLNEPKEPCH